MQLLLKFPRYTGRTILVVLLFFVLAGCSTDATEEHDVHVFSGLVLHYAYSSGILGAKVVLTRGEGINSGGNLNNPVLDSTHTSGTTGQYAMNFPKNPSKTYYSIRAEKPGYVFVNLNPLAKPIIPSITIHKDTLYLDSASILRINIIDAPMVNTGDVVTVTTRFTRPNGYSYSTERQFNGGINTFYLQEFSYAIYPNVTVSWTVTRNGVQVGSGSQQVTVSQYDTSTVTVSF